MKMTDVSGVVLAGGRNKRMGTNKAEMKLGDQTLLEIQVKKLKNLGIDDIMIWRVRARWKTSTPGKALSAAWMPA